MQEYKQSFLSLALEVGALKFGQFTLKSGRVSPYFFNAGYFSSGRSTTLLGQYYAQAIMDANLEFDMLFGPAYKGIPLVTSVAIALQTEHGIDVPYCYNRKEAKTHGEGGSMVGAELKGKVLLVDDVISAGTAIREAAGLIDGTKAELSGVTISLDRQEKGQSELSAVQEVQKSLGVSVTSIAGLDDLMVFLEGKGQSENAKQVLEYRKKYGV